MSAKAKAPLVMIHGAFAAPFVWDSFAGKFRAAGYAVETPCLRHHDEPSDSLAGISLKNYAADLEEVLDGLDAPPILIGHGMGGLLAQMLATNKNVHALVLLAPSPPWGVAPSSLFEIAAAQTMLLNVGFWNGCLKPQDHVLSRHGLERLAPAERDALMARLVPESGRAIFELMHWGMDMSRASEVEPGKISCPLLLLAGSEDRINPPATVERIAALYGTRARFEKLPGMNHWLPGEPGWESAADRTLNWLAEI